jgi:hypothetical protein
MPGRLAAIAGTVMVVGAAAAAVAIYLPGSTNSPIAGQSAIGGKPVADSLGRTVANGAGLAIGAVPDVGATTRAKPTAGSHASSGHASTGHASTGHASKPASHAARAAVTTHAQPKAAATVYLNPFRAVTGLQAQRIDMGADFGGAGPVYALGNAVITNAISNSPGWPGGGWITYRLTNGPAAGLMVYLAEDVTPTVQVGQHVTSSTVIANMTNSGAGIETGWAMPDGSSAESQLPVAGGISGQGPFPAAVGSNFEKLLVALGVPPSPFNANATPYGVVPSNYPASYSARSLKA